MLRKLHLHVPIHTRCFAESAASAARRSRRKGRHAFAGPESNSNSFFGKKGPSASGSGTSPSASAFAANESARSAGMAAMPSSWPLMSNASLEEQYKIGAKNVVRLASVFQPDDIKKRFYNKVVVKTTLPFTGGHNQPNADAGWEVMLDDKTILTTNALRSLTLPTRVLAHAVASEWESQWKYIRKPSMPLTLLADRSIDQQVPAPKLVHDMLSILEADNIAVRSGFHTASLKKQIELKWDPLLEWVNKKFSITILTQDATDRQYSNPDLTSVKEFLDTLSYWELQAFEAMHQQSSSMIIPLALYFGEIDLPAAVDAAFLEYTNLLGQTGGRSAGPHDVAKAEIEVAFGSAASMLNMLRFGETPAAGKIQEPQSESSGSASPSSS